MNALGSEISNVGGENTKCDLDWTVVDPMFDKVHDLADHQSDQKAHSDQIRQAQQPECESRCLTANQQRNPKFERKQGGGIVDQALAFQNVHNPFGQSDALGDRGSGNGIGRRHHGPEHQPNPPVETSEKPVADRCHTKYGERNQTKCQKQNADQIVGKFTPRGEPGRTVKQRRQDHKKDHIRIQIDPGDSRDKAEQQSANDQNNRIRSLQLLCQDTEYHDEQQHKQEDDLECMNICLHGDSPLQNTSASPVGVRK